MPRSPWFLLYGRLKKPSRRKLALRIDALKTRLRRGVRSRNRTPVGLWTDDYSDLYRILKQDFTRANLDVSARLQFLHDPAHHLARRPDRLRHVLLGQLLGYHSLPVDGLGHFHQKARDA